MHRKPNSTVVIVICGLAMLSLLSCSVGRAIVKGPQSPTATATATHRPTFTATISPTPRPTATATPQPTSTTPASPTPAAAGAAAPLNTPFVAAIVGRLAHYDAFVWDGTDRWKGAWAVTGGDPGHGEATGVWHAAVVKGNNAGALSPVFDLNSTQRCEGNGAVEWTKVDFTKQL
jgi:hypothetical protein